MTTARSVMRGGRGIARARDVLTEDLVVVKTAPIQEAIREARCLLALPPGVAPRARDLIWSGDSRLRLVLEDVGAESLKSAAAGIRLAEVPLLTLALAQALVHVHRAGWVHCDLKPSNIVILPHPPRFAVRLIDFGFAFDRFGGATDKPQGGTPPYWAPELQQGWMVDGRADLYSLGTMLGRLFPRLRREARWKPILQKLCREAPGLRYPDAQALRDEIVRVFDLAIPTERFSCFYGGPMQGRREAIKQLMSLICRDRRALVLVQARPGTGLSRFLREAVLEVAGSGGPAMRILDLSDFASQTGPERAIEHLERQVAAGRSLLVGLNDPTSGLHWTAEPARSLLRRLLERAGAGRLVLPPLDPGAFADAVATSIGSLDPLIEEPVQTLHRETGADLAQSTRALRGLLELSGRESGLAWRMDRTIPESAMRADALRIPPPFSSVPVELGRHLRLLARAGFSFSGQLAQELDREFCGSAALPVLLERGYLLNMDGGSGNPGQGRLRFLTRRLWRDAMAEPFPDAEVLAWLNENQSPDLQEVEEVLHVVRRARSLGDSRAEARWLSDSFEQAHRERRWGDVLRLLTYRGQSATPWTVEAGLGLAVDLARLMGGPWTAEKIFFAAATALASANEPVAVEFLRQAAEGREAPLAFQALALLADLRSDHAQDAEFQACLERLRAFPEMRDPPSGGIIAFLEARQAMANHDPAGALQLAQQALRGLEGSGQLFDTPCFQLVAVLRSSEDPAGAAAVLEQALRSASRPRQRAQLRHNLALIYSTMGRFEAAAVRADDGIREATGCLNAANLLGLRIQRAWAWADCDKIEPAASEARELLTVPHVRSNPRYLVPVRGLVSFCHLHRGNLFAAVHELLAACRESVKGPISQILGSIRALTDTLLDLDDQELMDQLRDELAALIPPAVPESDRTVIRLRALLECGTRGDSSAAAARLVAHLPPPEAEWDRVTNARYVHHLGLVLLARSAGSRPPDPAPARAAAQRFREELGMLPPVGQGYCRARGLLALARAECAAGHRAAARQAAAQALALAEQIGSLGLAGDCYQVQAQFDRDGDVMPSPDGVP